MAKKKQNFGVEFVNVALTTDDRKAFEEWHAKLGKNFPLLIVEAMQSNYKISLSCNPDTKSFTASMTGKEDSLNSGMCITSHAGTWEKALAVTLYKHFEIFSGEIWQSQERETDDWG